MPTLLSTPCSACTKLFLQRKNHITENFKLGHNLYCSEKCQFNHRKTGEYLTCDNSLCKNSFYRVKNDILKYNYCSQSCAAIVNNQRYPKWPKRYCAKCRREFKNRESKYCSSKCGWSAFKSHRMPKYGSEEICEIINKLAKKLGRSPARRELGSTSHMAIRSFGTWNNAILAASLIPNRSDDNRMYRRTKTRAKDGHACDSISEAIVDNWLHRNQIKHARNVGYPSTNHLADWSIKNGKIFIEYFGLAKDSPRYDQSIEQKQKLCKEHDIKLISIYPKDLYPINQLDKILNRLI